MWLKWTLTRLNLYAWISYLIIYISYLSRRKVDLPVRTFMKCIKLVQVECLLIRTDTLNYMHVINTLLYCLAAYRECHFLQKVLKNEFCVVSQSFSLHIHLPFWMLRNSLGQILTHALHACIRNDIMCRQTHT